MRDYVTKEGSYLAFGTAPYVFSCLILAVTPTFLAGCTLTVTAKVRFATLVCSWFVGVQKGLNCFRWLKRFASFPTAYYVRREVPRDCSKV